MKNKLLKQTILKGKMLAVAVALTCTLGLTACGRDDNNNQTGETQTQEMTTENSTEGETGNTTVNGNDYSEFDRLLNESTDSSEIVDYINTNIVDAGAADVERFFSGLLGFGDNIRDIDFTQLNDSTQYMSEDMIAFMDLMKLEAETPSMTMAEGENRHTINMTLSEMLERALMFEKHIVRYPDNVSTDAAGRLYKEIATAAITGGYDKEQGVEHYYKGDSADEIDRDSLQYYQQFAEANPDSNIGIIVQEYINILEANDFKINEAVEEYYRSLDQKLDIQTWAKAESQNTDEASQATEITTEHSTEAADRTNTEGDSIIEGTVVE